MGAINADINTLSNHSHLDASANYKFTHCMFENVVNYLCPVFSFLPLFYSTKPTEET